MEYSIKYCKENIFGMRLDGSQNYDRAASFRQADHAGMMFFTYNPDDPVYIWLRSGQETLSEEAKAPLVAHLDYMFSKEAQ